MPPPTGGDETRRGLLSAASTTVSSRLFVLVWQSDVDMAKLTTIADAKHP